MSRICENLVTGRRLALAGDGDLCVYKDTQWQRLDLNERFAVEFPPCTFQDILYARDDFYAAGTTADGQAVLHSSLTGELWTPVNLKEPHFWAEGRLPKGSAVGLNDLACLPSGLSQRPVCRGLTQGDAYRLTPRISAGPNSCRREQVSIIRRGENVNQLLFSEYRTLYALNWGQPWVMRLRVRMRDLIDAEAMRYAVDCAMRRYPYFCVELQKDDEYYLAENTRPVVISSSLHGVALNTAESNYHLIAFSYTDNWIIMDIAHAITD